ncbi:MAG TPA: AsmA-like C-terminal region-containing protein [Bacteroidales bacterium]|nr:AsmA-like C-terminal region-containing protein [Bacteroidales bacterium]
MIRTIKSILVGLILGAVILLVTSAAITYFYKDKVSLYLVEELNDHISAQIEVEKVKFSVLRKFPKASLELENVVVYSPQGYFPQIREYRTDTLFSAQSVFVQFNVADLFDNNYQITNIHLNDGDIRLFVDHLGHANYIFWEQKISDEKTEFNIDLKGVKITNSNLLYCNNTTKTTLKTSIHNLDFEGNFSHKNYRMKIRSALLVNQLEVEKINYLENKNVYADLALNIIDKINYIEDGILTIEDLNFNVAGAIDNTENKQIDLSIAGNKLSLKSTLENLPASVMKDFPLIQGQKGHVSINMNIKGDNITVNRPQINADFIVEKAQLYDEKRNARMEQIFVEGDYTNGMNKNPGSTQIHFKNFKATVKDSRLNGTFTLENLYDPDIDVELFAGLNLEDIHDYFKMDTLSLLNGNAEAHIKYSGKYKTLQDMQFADLFTPEYSVDLTLADASLQLKDNPVKLENINGKIELYRNLKAENLAFKIQDSDFVINGYISRLFEYIQHQKMFNVNATLSSNHLNLDQLSLLFKKESPKNTKPVYRLPEKVALSLKLDIKDFAVGKFSARNLRGDLNYKPKMFSIHEVSFYSMDGYVKAGGVITQTITNDFLVKLQSRLNEINIYRLFYSFNNFGQDFISKDNLNGNLTGEVYFSAEWNDQLEIYKNTVLAENDITITNGELINFEPMLGLSRFIDVQELEHIKFSTLKNQITIEDEKVYIPRMDIESSAINIAASGIHGFNNDFTYRVKVLLSDVLSGRLKRSVKRHGEYENVEDDGLGRTSLFLLIEGDPEDYKVKYDRKAAREELRQNIQQEKSTLQKIFQEEFGWGGKDSSEEKIREKQSNDDFKIEWEEEKNNQPTKKQKTDTNKQKFMIEWEEDTIH